MVIFLILSPFALLAALLAVVGASWAWVVIGVGVQAVRDLIEQSWETHMAKRKRMKGVDGQAVLAALQGRALELTDALGHRLGAWTSAKHKHGKGAKKSTCLMCGEIAIIMPWGNAQARGEAAQAPGIKGDATHTSCGRSPLMGPALDQPEASAQGRLL